MARNKYPEETVKRILDVAEALFMERGYENTTMADIVDGLGGLTKGAVYHHFKSKDEIFEAVFERANRPLVERIDAIMGDRSLSGLEKIRTLDETTSQGPSAEMWRAMRPAADPIRSARIMAREYADALEVAHDYVEPAIREGVRDGSIACDHPREVAEVMLLLSNLWMVPLFHPLSSEGEFRRRVEVMVRVMHSLGVDLVDFDSFDAERMWSEDWGRLAAEEPGGEGVVPSGGSDGPGEG